MSWRWITLTALLAALVVGYGTLVERGTPRPATSTQPEQPGYYLQNAVITQTQADGSLGIRLTAERIEQQHAGDGIAMSDVRVHYFHAPGQQWLLTARHGFVPAKFRIVQLQGDVELRPADGTTAAFLRTDALAIDTATSIAYSTTSPVRISFGQHAMRVKSFRADLNDEKIRLESVNGRYEQQ